MVDLTSEELIDKLKDDKNVAAITAPVHTSPIMKMKVSPILFIQHLFKITSKRKN